MVEVKKVNVGGVKVTLPNLYYFLEKLEGNEPFHFLKINHGFLDLLRNTYNNLDKLQEKISNSDFDGIVDDLYNSLKKDTYPNGENIKYYNGTSENVFKGLHKLIRLYSQNNSDKIKIGISSGVGLDYTFGEYSPQHDIQKRRNIILKNLIGDSEYFHSGILKHYCIMGELPILFNKLNELGFDVIFIGIEYFSNFKDTYNIAKFHHIEIPNRFAIDEKDKIVKSIKDIHTDKTILFHSTGHILSAELACEFKDTNIFGFDVGRSFDWDVKELIEPKRRNGKYDWINARWMNNHQKTYKDYIKSIRR